MASSFAASFWLTDASPAWAFYSLPSRVWELALGGLLAVGGRLARPRCRPGSLVAIGWLGVGLVGAGVVLIDGATPYPGLRRCCRRSARRPLIVAGAGAGPSAGC